MNRKGFTLVELIAMLVVVSVLMVIAVPNISGIIKKNRESIGVEDVNKMVRGAKTKFSVKSAVYPKDQNSCVVMTLDYIDTNDDFKTGINSGTYDRNDSFVVVKKVLKDASTNTSIYKFYVRLVETTEDGKSYVIGLVDYDDYSKNPETSKFENLTNDKKISVNFSDLSRIKTVIKTLNSNVDLCSGGVARVYS